MKKLITTCLIIALSICTFGLTACGGGASKEKLIVYTEAGFAPWEFTANGSTDIIGVDMEIAKYIANKYDYELEVINGDFSTIVAGIAEDNALGIAGISWKAKRAEVIEYSNFYYGGAFQSVVYLKSSNPVLVEEDFAKSNFNGKSVVYQAGTTSQMTIAENKDSWGIVNESSFDEVLVALQDMMQSNGSKYLIVDSQVAAQLCAENENCAYATIEGVDAESYGIVAKKGNTQLIEKVNQALAELLEKGADGKSQIDKWLDEFSAIEADE